MPHFFTLSSFSTATPRETSSDEFVALWFDEPNKEKKRKKHWYIFYSPKVCQTDRNYMGHESMSEDNMDMAMSMVIPVCWSVGWASRLAAERLLGKLTPLDFMRMSEMSVVLTNSVDERRTWGEICVKKLGSEIHSWTANYVDWEKKVRLCGGGYIMSCSLKGFAIIHHAGFHAE